MRVLEVTKAHFITWATVLFLLPAGCVTTGGPVRKGPPPAVADCERTTGYDVIIVGAGFSGLTASKELRRLGRHNVLILEATDRIGGRGSTLKSGPPIDLGGAWIHGVTVNPLTGMADAMGFERVSTDLEGPIYIDNGNEVSKFSGDLKKPYDEEYEGFEERLKEASLWQRAWQKCRDAAEGNAPKNSAWDSLCQQLEKLTHDKDVVAAYLPKNSPFSHLFEGNIGPLESAVETLKNSTVDAAEFEADPDDFLKEGMGTFVEAFGQGEPVCLSSPVTKITYSADGVVLEVKNGKRYQARKALVTVSTGVLQAKKIQFEPPLPPSKQEAINGLPMGNMQKVIIDFKDQPNLMGDTPPNSWVLYQDPKNLVMAFVIKPLGKNIAIGFYGGEEARGYEQQCASAMGDKPLPPARQPCDDEPVKKAKEALSRIYGKETIPGAEPSAPPLDIAQAVDKADIYLTRWSLDPWTLGAYSAALPDKWQLREKLGEAICPYDPAKQEEPEKEKCVKRLYFGGEATSKPMFNGSFAGAHEAGLRNARELIDSLEEEDASSK